MPWCKEKGDGEFFTDEEVCKKRGGMAKMIFGKMQCIAYSMICNRLADTKAEEEGGGGGALDYGDSSDDEEYDDDYISEDNEYSARRWRRQTDPNFMIDEKECLNGGSCDGYGTCTCTKGFFGPKCENWDEPEPVPAAPEPAAPEPAAPEPAAPEPPVPEPAAPVRCTEQDKLTKNCSTDGYLCPFVECDVCLPCQKRVSEKYTSGILNGCVKTEKCGEKTPIPTTCDEQCTEKIVSPGDGPLEGCEVEFCREKECPKMPEVTPCLVKKRVDSTCKHCESYVVEPVKNKCAEDQCFTATPENGECKIECKPPTPTNSCDKECEKETDALVDKEKCTKQVTCKKMDCQELSEKRKEETSQGCVLGEDNKAGPECQCELGFMPKGAPVCDKCMAISCHRNFSCPEPVTQCGKKYESLVEVEANPIEKKLCKMEKKKECLCTGIPESCGEGMELEVTPCPLTDEDCDGDKECCDTKCPVNSDGNREHKQCVPMPCLVCPDDKGAKLYLDEPWKNEEFCNSNKECCDGCKDATEVEVCPVEWSVQRKAFCKCKK